MAQNERHISIFKKLQQRSWKLRNLKANLNDIILELENENEMLKNERA